jgi:hypothetical protein
MIGVTGCTEGKNRDHQAPEKKAFFHVLTPFIEFVLHQHAQFSQSKRSQCEGNQPDTASAVVFASPDFGHFFSIKFNINLPIADV